MIKVIVHNLIQLSRAIRTSIQASIFVFVPYLIYTFFSTFLHIIEPIRNRHVENFIDWYMYSEGYILAILATIAIDWTLGTWKYIKLKEFNVVENIAGVFTKIAVVVLGAALFEALYIVVDKDSIIKDYLVIVTRLIIFIYPARSAFVSMSVVTGGGFPPKSWIDKIKSFEKTLDPNDFTNKNNRKNETK
jgi:hypothetical protein